MTDSSIISLFFLFRLTIKDGKNAASLFVAEQYVNAFNKLARTNNTLILPSNAGDITSLVGQAMSIYKTVSNSNDNNNNNSGNNNPLNDNDLCADKTTSASQTDASSIFNDSNISETDVKQSGTSHKISPDDSKAK